MHDSSIIEVSGQFAGAALNQEGSLRFVAVDPRVKELDRSVWSTLPEMKRGVADLLLAKRIQAKRRSP